MRTDEKNLMIPKIENGHVIDHVPVGLGSVILQLLETFPAMKDVPVTLGRNFSSRRLGKKDLIKISADELPEGFLRQLTLVASGVTIKQIRDYRVVRKIVAQPPDIISGLLTCLNPNCITNHERHLRPCFHCSANDPLTYTCNFCERPFLLSELQPASRALPFPPPRSGGR